MSPHVVLELTTRPTDLDGAARFAEALSRMPGTCDVRALGHRVLAQVAIARGRVARFRREVAEAGHCDPGAALELSALVAVQPFVNPSDAELTDLVRRLRTAPDTILAWPSRPYYVGLVAIRSGDTLTASRNARALLRSPDTSDAGDLARTLGRSLRAHIRSAARRPAEALAQLEAAGWERTAGQSVAEASDRFFRAELLRVVGRSDEAIGWYQSMAERATYELAYVAPAEQRLGRIFDARGAAGDAAVHYRRFIELWKGADPELQPMVEVVKRRLRSE